MLNESSIEMNSSDANQTHRAHEKTYLTFVIADKTYALTIDNVVEVVGLQSIMMVPDMPSFIKGVMNYRGKVIAVLDMRLRLGLPAREYSHKTSIIVIDVDGIFMGLIVDHVHDVFVIAPEQISSLLEVDAQEDAMVSGIARHEGMQTRIINVDAVVAIVHEVVA